MQVFSGQKPVPNVVTQEVILRDPEEILQRITTFGITRKNGFTTLEAILVVALLSLIVVAIAPYFRTTIAGWEVKDRYLEVLQNGRVGMDEMIRTIKTATEFTDIRTDYIRFTDGDGNDIGFRRRLVNNVWILQKRVSGRWHPLVEEPVDSLEFTYFDKNGYVTSIAEEVRSVRIVMTVSDSEGRINPITFSSQVSLRKDVLIYRLAINEINYNPRGGRITEYRREWIELYNYGSTAIDLSGWQISDNRATDNLEPRSGTMTIPAGGYAIITANPTDVYTYYIVDPSAVRLQVDDSRIGNGLSNRGETITIRDPSGDAVESVTYDDAWGGDGDGDTIERKDAQSAPSEPSNWEASSFTDTYTAGSANSVSP